MVKLNAFLQPEGAPVTSERKQMGFDTDSNIEIQTKTIRASEINVADLAVISNGTVTMKVPTEIDSSLQVDGSAKFNNAVDFGPLITYSNPMNVPGTMYVGGSAVGTANMIVYGTLDVHTPINRTNDIDATPFRVRGADNEVVIRYNLRVSNLYFYENGANGIHEANGVNVYLADNGGTNSFSVKNSDNVVTFKVPTNGGMWLLPTSGTPTATEGAMFFDANTHALKYYNGSEWITP
jgi:hypothetical protein